MASTTAALSRTLKTITLTKINELEKQRKAYANSKNAVLESAAAANDDQRERALRLLQGVEDLNPPASTSNIDIKNIRRFLEQSHFDASIPTTMLDYFEIKLRSQLDVQSRRLDLAALYSRLLTEWLNPKHVEDQKELEHDGSLDGSFEVVEQDCIKGLKDIFESVVFSPLEIDEKEIFEYLGGLFPGDAGGKALTRLRQLITKRGAAIMGNKAPFDETSIKWCLKGLLANDLLRDDKKAILQDFLKDEIARAEICDVLNMKYTDIANWQWDAGPEGLPVEPRRQLNGKYRIMMDEDILDAIFLHYIGMMWSSGSHNDLVQFVRFDGVWKRTNSISEDAKDRRRYFLDRSGWGVERTGVEKLRHDMFHRDFFLSQIPWSVCEGAGGYEDEDGEVDLDYKGSDKKSPKEVKQQLLRLLATEVKLHKSLNGECAVVQSDFKWFGTALPHSTIFAVLKFAGVNDEWIKFFKQFLEAPLNMSPVSDGEPSAKAKIRTRGTPIAHALEKFVGEFVLFFMDLAVNQEGGNLLYRFHDDLWLVGEPKKCARAWKTMERFSKVMGLELNGHKTGSVFLTKEADFSYEDSQVAASLPSGPVSIGFLYLDPKSGEWLINKKDVDAHVKQLSKQLASSNSILSWVQTWNSCIGRFFSHTFGEPANCLGRKHVDSILDTYKYMQDIIFPGSNVSSYLKSLIHERFGITDVPDAFIFLPESFGGLGVRNPFVNPFLVRKSVLDPSEIMEEYFETEKEEYDASKAWYESLSPQAKKRQLHLIYTDEYGDANTSSAPSDTDPFMSFEEYISCRESVSPELQCAYQDLMGVPRQQQVVTSEEVIQAIRQLEKWQPELVTDSMRGEMKWLLQMHEKELLEKCGGMSIVEKNLLPLGILTILRKKRVAWQMVL
ncbi:hypothetical protein DL98DRAFT_519356 [Cadophora sp. DSE1049]|nr:hypothetical protein DL98DRAFT_519356 [Cadophora sp. DSE1049]